MDDILGAYKSAADPEIIASFLVEYIESFGDEIGLEDIIDELEEHSSADGSLAVVLEGEFEASDLTVTAEEAVSILERTCGIEWSNHLAQPEDKTEEYRSY